MIETILPLFLIQASCNLDLPPLPPGMKYILTIMFDIEVNKTRIQNNITYDTEFFFTIPDNVTLNGYYYRLTRLAPRTFTSVPIMKINGGANLEILDEGVFASNENLTVVNFSQTSIHTIVDNAFEDCPNLHTILLPPTLGFIGSGIFKNSGISSVDFSNTKIKNIPSRAFANCGNLSFVKLPRSCKALLEGAFEYSSIKTIHGLQFLENFGPYSLSETEKFDQNIDLTKSDKITEIGDGAFLNCGSPEIILPNNLQIIGKSSFKLSKFGEHFRPSKSLNFIKDEAFANCQNLKSVDLSQSSIKYIPNGCFLGCRNINFIIFPQSTLEIGDSAFLGCSSIQSIRIPTSVEVLGQLSLSNMDSISVIDLSDTNITLIHTNTFVNDNSLSVIYFPPWIDIIMMGALYNCSSLTEVYFEYINDIGQPVFDNELSKLRVHVPADYSGHTVFGYKPIRDGPALNLNTPTPTIRTKRPKVTPTHPIKPTPDMEYDDDVEKIEQDDYGYMQLPISAIINAAAFVFILIIACSVFLVIERMEKFHTRQISIEDMKVEESSII